MPKYLILSMDGGGIRGVFTARLLERIYNARPDFSSSVKLLAGTSTGSILAIALAKGVTPAQLVQLYKDKGSVLFARNLISELTSVDGIAAAKYTTQQRHDAIYSTIGDDKLGDVATNVLVATFQLDSQNRISPDTSAPRRWKAKFFHNYPTSALNDDDRSQSAMDVIMRSSAAPTYFPIYQGFVDGGVVANNPSMCALAQAVNPETGGQDIHDVALLSIGTGGKPEYLTETNANWGVAEWGFKLLDLMFDSGLGLADYQCQQMLGECYMRLDAALDKNVGLDDVASVDYLIEIASGIDLSTTLAWIDTQTS